MSHNHYTISYEKNQYLMTVFQKVDFGIIKEKSDSLWNLIVSPLESAISYKFLMFQKIPYRDCLYGVPFLLSFNLVSRLGNNPVINVNGYKLLIVHPYSFDGCGSQETSRCYPHFLSGVVNNFRFVYVYNFATISVVRS